MVASAYGQNKSSEYSDTFMVQPAPTPPPPSPPLEGFITYEEVLPLFPGCENAPPKKTSICTSEKIIEYVYDRLVIPADIEPSEANCMAIVQFVINVDGSLSDFALCRDPCEGCGAAAMAAVKSLQQVPPWTPARQFGRKTKILYTLPIKFDRP